ncbi:CAPA peptides-like [Colletes gigas]|uniref:CAPA peptides-like n=1 Tax=Colletes gigas TaxID=935657 RepID=UPI001C9A67FD|nr:CAPA peptides-like [Colletes gigas]
MTNHLFVFLVVLIFSTSLNRGEKLKANNRRASGLVPYPRIGRNSDMAGFSRLDRASGLVNFPRVGRSEMPISNINFNRYRDMEPDAEFQFYNEHDTDLDHAEDQDFEGYARRSMNVKNKNLKDAAWLIPDRLRMKEYRSAQKIDDTRSLFPNTQELRSSPSAFGDAESV